jgi:D-3-phosphoglycerate dehydrogenase
VTDYTFDDFSCYEAALAALPCDLLVPARPGEAAFLEIARDADALLHEHLFLTAPLLRELRRCRVIAHHGKGVDNIALSQATSQGMVVANVLDASLHEVAEHVFALLFAVARRVTTYDAAVRAGRWDLAGGAPAYRLHRKTLGRVGFGRIAQCVAVRAAAFGMRVLVYARRPDPLLARALGVEHASLDEVFERADALSLHLPLTEATERIASRERLARMKRSAILLNVSRGGLVDEPALADMLASGRLLGAGLDVLTAEPPPPAHPLLALANVVVTPHTAWYSEEGRVDVETRTAEAAVDVLSGIEPASWVNPEARESFEARFGALRPRT